jgi:endonuclease YncB( thermonuclease family)
VGRRRSGCRGAFRLAELTTPEGLRLGDFAPRSDRPFVVDGDTLRVEGLQGSLRLLGIDTEETFKDAGRLALARRDWDEYLKLVYAGENPARPPKFGTPLGEAARHFAETFFADAKSVRLEHDDPARKTGYYGRHLVHVLLQREGGWVHYNVEVVRQGLSPYFVKYGRCRRYHERFLAAEAEARAARRGIWAEAAAQGALRGYPDYGTRLRWWSERAAEVAWIAGRAAKEPSFHDLSVPAAWEALRAAEGREVTVAGSVSRLRKVRKIGLLHLAHRNRKDFLIAGPREQMERHALHGLRDEMVWVRGVVSLHRGQPQFRVEAIRAFGKVREALEAERSPLGERDEAP